MLDCDTLSKTISKKIAATETEQKNKLVGHGPRPQMSLLVCSEQRQLCSPEQIVIICTTTRGLLSKKERIKHKQVV